MCRKPFRPPSEKDEDAWPEPALGKAIRMTLSQKAHDRGLVLKLAQEIYESLQAYRNCLTWVTEEKSTRRSTSRPAARRASVRRV